MADFDLSVYFPLPLLNSDGYASLCNTMLDVAPTVAPVHVAAAVDALRTVVAEARVVLVSRLDEDRSTGLERAFDGLTDQLWLELRGRLEFFALYKHPGVDKLTDEDREYLEFDLRLEQARVAGLVLERLFGKGSDFLGLPFPQQAIQMTTRLDWVDSKGLVNTLEDLATPELMRFIGRCQLRYDEMVVARNSRDGRSGTNLRELRDHLRRQLYAYIAAVATIVDPAQPATIAVVENALRPILIARSQARRKLTGESEADVIDEVETPEFGGELEGGKPKSDPDGESNGSDEASG